MEEIDIVFTLALSVTEKACWKFNPFIIPIFSITKYGNILCKIAAVIRKLNTNSRFSRKVWKSSDILSKFSWISGISS